MTALAGDVVVRDVPVQTAGSGRGRSTVVRLSWSERDPLAVTLRVTAKPDHPALPRGEWCLLRDFLRYGLDEPTGDGIVRIRPDLAGASVVFELRRTGRPCSLSLPAAVVREFLDATDGIVPAGEERSDEAVDELIDRLLYSG